MPTPLISAPELLALLRSPDAGDLLLLDCRFNLADTGAGQAAFAQGHLPGAVYAHLDTDLSGPKTGANGRHPLPSPEAFSATLGRWGLQPHTRVVAYDAAGGMFAARLWWMLSTWWGHAEVQVLDGGWPAWQAAGGPVDTAEAPRPLRVVPPVPLPESLVRADELLAHLGQTDTPLLIDARAADRFRGENETLDPVGGHIPGAQNRFFQLNLAADGRFKAPAALQAEFEALLGGRPAHEAVHSCGSGVTACHNLLAMAVAGLPGARLYAGSWSEWCAAPERPVARG
ncbi:sulfurtransferase [Aquabacterium sp.]|uniref:sulfurtransferase n=1 Tax=Aquabacterium sp. TaxID=1872578 RepID=UPI0025B7AAA6|nr:sulfurtransferase [Aquabacterium sp.]